MDKIEILFEDNHLLVAIKPAGILSQKDRTGDLDMLTLLRAYLKEKYKKPGNVYLGLLHRLDRPVRGIMVFAKTSKAASRISAQIRDGKMKKGYRAIVQGCPDTEKKELVSWIQKDRYSNHAKILSPIREASERMSAAKQSRLFYERVSGGMYNNKEEYPIALLEIELLTGRSHQIRVQLASDGFPILGDRKYTKTPYPYRGDICLEAFSLSFMHPVTKEAVSFLLSGQEESPWNVFAENNMKSEELEYDGESIGE